MTVIPLNLSYSQALKSFLDGEVDLVLVQALQISLKYALLHPPYRYHSLFTASRYHIIVLLVRVLAGCEMYIFPTHVLVALIPLPTICGMAVARHTAQG